MNSKKKKEIAVNGLFGQFITYLLSPRKKQFHTEKKVKKSRYGGGSTQGKRECSRRLRQLRLGILCTWHHSHSA